MRLTIPFRQTTTKRVAGRRARAPLLAQVLAAGGVACALMGGPAFAAGPSSDLKIRAETFVDDTCAVVDEVARRHDLPHAFLTRLIWRESLFNPSAVSHKGAQGIAQFMPQTASERGLSDPFDPAPALAASAHLLADLKGQFGNWGLAAAAYNAGAGRVADWLSGSSGLPAETQQYVHWITGHRAEDWVKESDLSLLDITEDAEFEEACTRLVARAIAPLQPEALAGAAPPPSLPWGVQIAAHFSRETALAQFARTRDRFSSVLGSHSPVTVTARNRSRGSSSLHSVRVEAATRADAEDLCESLRNAGGSCVVLRN